MSVVSFRTKSHIKQNLMTEHLFSACSTYCTMAVVMEKCRLHRRFEINTKERFRQKMLFSAVYMKYTLVGMDNPTPYVFSKFRITKLQVYVYTTTRLLFLSSIRRMGTMNTIIIP